MDEPALTFLLQRGSTLNAVRLTVRGEFVEPPAAYPEHFDKLSANGIH